MSPNTGSGNSWAWLCTAASSMRISTSPVARSAFTVSGVRATTLPVSVITHSERAWSTVGKAAASGSITHWVMP